MALPFPDIDPVAFQIGPLPLRWYALAYLAGFIGGWRYALRLAEQDDNRYLKKTDIDDFVTWAVIGVILGGRTGYVLFYQAHLYMTDPLAIMRIWEGGMSFHGGAAGVIAAMIAFAWKRKLPLLRLTDIVCAVVPIGLFFGRIANFINGELYGRITTAPWGIIFPRGGPEPRHASQIYEALLEGLTLGLILFFMAQSENIRNKPGLISGVFLTGYAIFRSFIEFFREPDIQIGLIGDTITMGQLLCLPMALGGLLLIYLSCRQKSSHAGSI